MLLFLIEKHIIYNLPMLGHNETQLDSYNKNKPQAHGTTSLYPGTLIANWYEERVHRD